MTTIAADNFLKNTFSAGSIMAFAISLPAYANNATYCVVTPAQTQTRIVNPPTTTMSPEVDGMYLSMKTRRLIGEHGVGRFNRFKQLRAGWDAGRGLPLDVASVQTMESFVNALPFEPPQVALFMSAKGHPILNWLDQNGGAIELEFGEDSVNYYNETGELEEDFSLSHIDHLVASLSAA
ncbi:hypothetical protein [Cupriavidus pinatubonensis]|uniref:hypothetical protein n=1 Tax=Cupriavidus pinatubonensis TaxID=248026 RepID=UPI00112CCD2B|nr:hypothetical protein [Cupriavidus pinatubonensis]TPQ39880.1 hypothetical protein C2U69_11235 [Cupriavidus pinatubonensis]